MKKTYCPSRGCQIEYGEVRPKWCPHCGSSMLSNTESSSPPPVRRPQPQTQNWEDEVEANDFDLDPSLIRVNIAARAPQGVKAEAVFGTGSTGFGSRPKIAAKDYKNFEKKMREEKPDPIEI